jgi:predicted nucleotidyltransferase
MVMEDTGAMVSDVLDEPELRPLWGGMVRANSLTANTREPGIKQRNIIGFIIGFVKWRSS